MQFKLLDNGKEVICDIVKIFSDSGNKISYVVYTDGTKDENGNPLIYASRYNLDGKDYILNPIENEY